ncbi:hypothetical protein CYANOKiyG1_49320 [Okeania sp. KiyG1]|nr:hypothetical protein CYANOKiyG1_49320 [Okeania sp. KiyG1]
MLTYKLNTISWERLNLNLTYQPKYALYVIVLLPGEKNGLSVGIKSNIVLKGVGDANQILTNKLTYNLIPKFNDSVINHNKKCNQN